MDDSAEQQPSPASTSSSGPAPNMGSKAGLTMRPKACKNCATAKAKCVWPAPFTDASRNCQRCSKFKLECTERDARPRKKRGKSTRIGQLEQRIESLVSILSANQANIIASQTPAASGATESHAQAPVTEVSNGLPAPTTWGPATTDAVHSVRPIQLTRVDPEKETIEIIPGYEITLDKADQILKRFREEYVPHFPFVPIPVGTTAYYIHQTSPLLFHVIVLVVDFEPGEQHQSMRDSFRTQIATRMIVKGEKSVDLLKAILLFLAWAEFQYYLSTQGTDFLQLAIALAIDMWMYKPPETSWGLVPRSFLEDAAHAMKGKMGKPHHDNEDKRACLGVFYTASMTMILFRRPHIFPFNSYLEKCCDDLLAAEEYESDKYLVALVRMQHILSRVNGIAPISSDGSGSYDGSVHMSVMSVRKELEELVRNQPESVKSNHMFWTQYHVAMVRLHEVAAFMQAPVDGISMQPLYRTEGLWACLQACTSFFDAFFMVPTAIYPRLSFSWMAGLAFTLVTSSRLLLMKDTPDWDAEMARKSFDFVNVITRLVAVFEECNSLNIRIGSVTHPESNPLRYAYKVRWIRNWYIERINPAEAQAASMSGSVMTPGMDMLDEVDGTFWTSIFDYGFKF